APVDGKDGGRGPPREAGFDAPVASHGLSRALIDTTNEPDANRHVAAPENRSRRNPSARSSAAPESHSIAQAHGAPPMTSTTTATRTATPKAKTTRTAQPSLLGQL